MIRAGAALKARLGTERLVLAPGAYDCITARAIQAAGFGAVYMTGSGTAAAHGFPDFGLLTMSEMAANAARLTDATDIPVIADGDTGFGNELNVTRTIQTYEQAGVAAIQLEDQAFPKKCGHLSSKSVIPCEAFESKIRAAVAARRDPDFLLIARSDARASDGLEEAIRRVNLALDAGADIGFVEAPQTLEEMAAVPAAVRGPCLLNIVWRGKSPEVDFEDAAKMGYKIAILPSLLLKTVMGASAAILAETKSAPRHPVPPGDIDLETGFKLSGSMKWDAVSAHAAGTAM